MKTLNIPLATPSNSTTRSFSTVLLRSTATLENLTPNITGSQLDMTKKLSEFCVIYL